MEINRYSFNSFPGDGGGSGGIRLFNDSGYESTFNLLINVFLYTLIKYSVKFDEN